MKTLKNTGRSLFTALAFLILAATNPVKAQPGMSVSFQLFYDELAPYGEWVNDSEYGYIWLPNAEPDFQPYASNGHWVMTTYGNTWVSNYEWGWAPFHYGRWAYTDYYGWAWVPGYEWGPAWVSWRSGGGYYGWAPLGPRMSININIGIPHNHWVFVPQRYICSPRIYSYYVPYRSRVNIYNRTTIINNTYIYNNRTYVSGPRRNEIERVTRSRVTVRDINGSARPGRATVNSRSVSIYRPEIDRNTRSSARPSRVADAATVRSAGAHATSSRTSGRTQATAPTGSSATRSSATRNNTATRGTQTTIRESRNTAGTARTSSERTEAATPARQSTPARTRTESNTIRTAPATRAERNTTSRPEVSNRSQTSGQQRTTAPNSRQSTRPATRESSRPAVRMQTVSSRDNVTPTRTQSNTSARSGSVSSRSSARPSVSASRSDSKSSSSAARSRSSERPNSTSRSR